MPNPTLKTMRRRVGAVQPDNPYLRVLEQAAIAEAAPSPAASWWRKARIWATTGACQSSVERIAYAEIWATCPDAGDHAETSNITDWHELTYMRNMDTMIEVLRELMDERRKGA